MKTRVLIENGEGNEISLIGTQILPIASWRESLYVDGIRDLHLVGRLERDGAFISTMWNEKTQRSLPKYITSLKPRIIIIEDRRVFYSISSEESTGNHCSNLNLFLGEQFKAYGSFESRFEKLYRDYFKKKISN